MSVASIDAKDITSFKILGVYGDIVGTNISLTLPYGTSKLSLTPTIQITGQSVSPVSGVSQDFTGPKTYTVYDANTPPGTKNYTVIVNILACPAGQTKPYSVCNSSNGVCESVDACGATTCTVNSCGIEEPLIIDSIFPPTTTND